MNKDYSKILKSIEKSENDLLREYEHLLEVNCDLDRTTVSFQANKKTNEHRWFKYKEGFSSSFIKYIVQKLDIQKRPILDPFAGSGTTLFTASELGLDSVGIEFLPSSIETLEARETIRKSKR